MRSSGITKQSLAGWKTFLPNKLPPQMAVAPKNLSLAEDATHLLGQVNMCRTLLPNADLLVYSSLQREAIASSTIEGTIATPDELLRFEASQSTDRGQVREVANYSVALREGREHIRNNPLTLKLIYRLHEILMLDVRGNTAAGNIKTSQNFIGGYGKDAVFTPAAPEDTSELLSNLETYINEPQREMKVIQVALTHYQFETIHPFNDGNGRVGRLMIILHLIQLGLLDDPLIYPSVYFERTRSQYYDALQGVREKAAWNEYLSYFLRGIIGQCRETLYFTKLIGELQQQVRQEIRGVQRHASVERVLGEFFKSPVLRISDLATRASLSFNTTTSCLNDLQAKGIVIELTGNQRKRVFACKPVIDLIFGSSAVQ